MVSSVLLPDPLGPMIATNSPASTVRWASCKACTSPAPSPYDLDTPIISSTAVIGGLRFGRDAVAEAWLPVSPPPAAGV